MDAFTLAAVLTLDSSKFESGLSSSEGKFKGLGSSIATGAKNIAKALAGAQIVKEVVNFGKEAINAGKQFDKAMSQVAATMGKSSKEIKNLRDFARQMGATTAFSAQEAAEALNYMALAGYDAEQSMEMLPTVLNLAAAGGIALASASDMVTDAQSALGLSFEQTTKLVDQMAKTSSKTNTSVAQLGEAILTIGGTAKDVAGGTTELTVALGILADNGIKGAEGGTALRNVILSLEAPTDKAAETMKKLGLQVFDASGNLRALPDIFGDLNAKLKTMTTEERTNVLNELFNKVDLKAVNALLGTNIERWEDLLVAIENADGAAEAMAETQLDNLAGDITKFQSALGEAQIAISDVFTPALRTMVQTGTVYLTSLTNAFKEGGLSGAISEAASIIGGLAAKVKTAFDNAVKKIGEIDWAKVGTDLLTKIGNGLADIANWFKTKFEAASTGIAKINWKQVGENVKTAIGNGLTAIKEWFQTTFLPGPEGIALVDWKGAGTSILNAIGTAFAAVITFFQGLFSGVPAALTGEDSGLDWAGAGQSILKLIGSAFATIGDWITALFGPAVTALTGEELTWSVAGSNILGLITAGIGDVVDWATKLFQGAADAILTVDWVGVGSKLRLWIETAVVGIINWFNTTFGLAKDEALKIEWAKLGESIVNLIQQGLAAIDGIFSGLFGKGWEDFKNTIKDLIPILVGVAAAAAVVGVAFVAVKAAMAFTDVITKLQTSFTNIFNVITNHPFVTIIAMIVGLIAALITAYNTNEEFRNKVDAAWKAIKETAETVWTAIKTAVETCFNGIKSAWDGVKNFFTVTIPLAWSSLMVQASIFFAPIKAVIDGAIRVIETVWNAVKAFFTTTIPDAWKTFKEKADKFIAPIKGIIEGISTAVQSLINWWNNLLGLDSKKDFDVALTTTQTTIINTIVEGNQSTSGLGGGGGNYTGATVGGMKSDSARPKMLQNARSMFGGTILRGATLFGWDAQGVPQIGGGEGPEAIVGVNSLDQMIASSVQKGLSGIVGAIASAVQGDDRKYVIVLDTGALVGGIAQEMDAELARMGNWTAGGAA